MQRRQKIPVPQCCGTGYFHRGWDLLLDEGQAVRALINRRIGFMGSNTNLIEGTVILQPQWLLHWLTWHSIAWLAFSFAKLIQNFLLF